MEHRPSPDDGLVAGIEQPDGHGFDAVVDRRDYHLAANNRHVFAAHHNRHVRAVNVGVEDAHFRAHQSERHGQIDRDRGFTHAAFAGADRDDVFDAGDLGLVDSAASLRHFRLHLDFDAFDAGHGHDGLLGLEFELITHGTGGRSQNKTKADYTATDLHVADHVERDDVFAQVGVLDRPQRIEDYVLGNLGCLRSLFTHISYFIFHISYLIFHMRYEI